MKSEHAKEHIKTLTLANAELLAENAKLRHRLRYLDTFLSGLRKQILEAQGIEKNVPLGRREIADRGFRNA